MSKNRKYLNLTLVLKSGQTDDKKAIQSLALVCDSIRSKLLGVGNYISDCTIARTEYLNTIVNESIQVFR